MRNKLFFLLILSLFAFPSFAKAADLNLSPVNSKSTVGKTFTVSVLVDPGIDKIYTVKSLLKFSADLLEVKSFTFSSGWLPLQQPGYDSIDNVNGLLTKTAGYMSGLSERKSLGTVTFYAKKAGNAEITGSNGILLLNDKNENKLVGYNKSNWIIENTTTTEVVKKTIEKTTDSAAADAASILKKDGSMRDVSSFDVSEKRNELRDIEIYIIGAIITATALIAGIFIGKKIK